MNEIKEDIDKLFDDFKESNLYQNYLSVKKQINNNDEIMYLINEIKRLQKIYVNTKDRKINEELLKLNETLNSYPIYQDYIAIIEEINTELYEVSNQFDKYFEEILKI